MGPSVLHLDHLLPRLAAAVALTTAIFCAYANAQNYPDNQALRVAQAGSTGGSIGKTDKSISGGEVQPSASSRPRSSKPADREVSREESVPKAIQLNEHALGGHWSITLRNVGGNIYHGTWSHGYVTSFTMTSLTKTSVKMERTDNPTFWFGDRKLLRLAEWQSRGGGSSDFEWGPFQLGRLLVIPDERPAQGPLGAAGFGLDPGPAFGVASETV